MTDPVAPNTEPGAEPAQGNSTQDRINLLTRRRHDAERNAASLAEQNTALTDRIAALEARPAPAAAPAPSADPFSSPAASPQPAATGAIDANALQALVAKAVQDAVAPVTESVQATQRNAQHARAFSETAKQLPSLADANSELYQTFNEVWASRPDLQALDDGVAIAAFAAQGIIGAQPAAPTGAAKTAASVNVPRQAPQNLLPNDSDKGKAQEIAKTLRDQGAQSGLDAAGWESMLAAELAGQTPE